MSIMEPLRLVWKALQTWWDGWFGLLLFGSVWVICWVTIVLGPPATFGLFHAVRWWMVERETRWDQYFRMAKKHFLTSWLWFLVNLMVLFTVYANVVFYNNLQNQLGSVLRVIALGVGFLWIAVQLYTLPYYVLLEKKSLRLAWKNGLFTILASPLFSLVLWAVLIGVFYLHLTILPLFLGGPGLIVLLVSMAVEERIQKFGVRERDTHPNSA